MTPPHDSLDDVLQQMRRMCLERRPHDALALVDRCLAQADPARLSALNACRTAVAWHLAALEGRCASGLEEAIAAIEGLSHLGFEQHLEPLRIAAGFAMGLTGNVETGLQWVGRVAESAQARGDLAVLRFAVGDRAALHSVAGDYEASEQQYTTYFPLWDTGAAPDASPAERRVRATMLNNWAFCRLLWARSLPEGSPRRQQVATRALESADAARSLTPGPEGAIWTTWSLSNRGHALTLLGRWDEAEQTYSECEALQPAHPRIDAVAMAGQARLMAETGRFDQARRLLERAHEIAPDDLLDSTLDLIIDTGVLLAKRARDIDGLAHWSEQQHERLKAQFQSRQAAALRQNQLLSSLERERVIEREKATESLQRGREVLQRVGAAYEAAAWHDLLTGLPNRTLGRIRLQQALDSGPQACASLAVACVGIDRFKDVNTRHGQAVGDEVLRMLGQRLTQALRPEDLVCRLSGDQFMVLWPQARGDQEVGTLCERLQACCGEPFITGALSIRVSLSIGAALSTAGKPPVDADLLMAHADIALMEAKKLGTNRRTFYTPGMSEKRLQQAQTRDALQLALERGEFSLHYQPKIDLGSGRVVGAEALLRWQRPDGRVASPGEFIDTAEDSGLIVPIGRWALLEACRQAAAWETAWSRGLSVAVNLSGVQFRHGQVVEDIEDALRRSGLAASLLEVELTESVLLRDDDYIADTLARLKALGVQRSIDDFGTGYSSLAYLKRFAIDKLKIDRSFIEHMQRDDRDRGIVQAMIDIARSLQIRTVAEGVEDAKLAQALQQMGCNEAQGYHYARPMPPPQFEAWLAQRAAS